MSFSEVGKIGRPGAITKIKGFYRLRVSWNGNAATTVAADYSGTDPVFYFPYADRNNWEYLWIGTIYFRLSNIDYRSSSDTSLWQLDYTDGMGGAQIDSGITIPETVTESEVFEKTVVINDKVTQWGQVARMYVNPSSPSNVFGTSYCEVDMLLKPAVSGYNPNVLQNLDESGADRTVKKI